MEKLEHQNEVTWSLALRWKSGASEEQMHGGWATSGLSCSRRAMMQGRKPEAKWWYQRAQEAHGRRWSRFSPLSPKDGGTSDFNNLMVVVSLGRRETLRPRAVRSKRYLNKKNTEFWTCAGGISRLGVDVVHSECVVCHGRWLTEMITGTEDLQVISSKSQDSRVQNLFTNLTVVQWLLGKELEVLV